MAAGAGAAVKIDRGNAVTAANGLHVDFVAVADVEMFCRQGRERIGRCGRFADVGIRWHCECPDLVRLLPKCRP